MDNLLQAHAQARFVITNVLLEASDNLITVTEPVANEKLLITLNKEKLHTTGLNAIKDFLLKLQVSFFVTESLKVQLVCFVFELDFNVYLQ